MISVDSCKRALSSRISVAKHSTPAPEAMLTNASVAIFLSFAVSLNWSNKFLNLDLYCKVVMVAAAGLDSLLRPLLGLRKLPPPLHPSLGGSGVGFFELLAGTVLEYLL